MAEIPTRASRNVVSTSQQQQQQQEQQQQEQQQQPSADQQEQAPLADTHKLELKQLQAALTRGDPVAFARLFLKVMGYDVVSGNTSNLDMVALVTGHPIAKDVIDTLVRALSDTKHMWSVDDQRTLCEALSSLLPMKYQEGSGSSDTKTEPQALKEDDARKNARRLLKQKLESFVQIFDNVFAAVDQKLDEAATEGPAVDVCAATLAQLLRLFGRVVDADTVANTDFFYDWPSKKFVELLCRLRRCVDCSFKLNRAACLCSSLISIDTLCFHERYRVLPLYDDQMNIATVVTRALGEIAAMPCCDESAADDDEVCRVVSRYKSTPSKYVRAVADLICNTTAGSERVKNRYRGLGKELVAAFLAAVKVVDDDETATCVVSIPFNLLNSAPDATRSTAELFSAEEVVRALLSPLAKSNCVSDPSVQRMCRTLLLLGRDENPEHRQVHAVVQQHFFTPGQVSAILQRCKHPSTVYLVARLVAMCTRCASNWDASRCEDDLRKALEAALEARIKKMRDSIQKNQDKEKKRAKAELDGAKSLSEYFQIILALRFHQLHQKAADCVAELLTQVVTPSNAAATSSLTRALHKAIVNDENVRLDAAVYRDSVLVGLKSCASLDYLGDLCTLIERKLGDLFAQDAEVAAGLVASLGHDSSLALTAVTCATARRVLTILTRIHANVQNDAEKSKVLSDTLLRNATAKLEASKCSGPAKAALLLVAVSLFESASKTVQEAFVESCVAKNPEAIARIFTVPSLIFDELKLPDTFFGLDSGSIVNAVFRFVESLLRSDARGAATAKAIATARCSHNIASLLGVLNKSGTKANLLGTWHQFWTSIISPFFAFFRTSSTASTSASATATATATPTPTATPANNPGESIYRAFVVAFCDEAFLAALNKSTDVPSNSVDHHTKMQKLSSSWWLFNLQQRYVAATTEADEILTGADIERLTEPSDATLARMSFSDFLDIFVNKSRKGDASKFFARFGDYPIEKAFAVKSIAEWYRPPDEVETALKHVRDAVGAQNVIDSNHLTTGKCLGSGGFGAVYECTVDQSLPREKFGGRSLVVKVCAVSPARHPTNADAPSLAEARRMLELDSPFLTKCLAVTVARHPVCVIFTPALIMEKATNDLHSIMRWNREWNTPMTTQEIFCVSCDIARGLKDLHSHNLNHNDLKPANCLVFDDPQGGKMVKISDFGSLIETAAGVSRKQFDHCICGFTTTFLAPEFDDGNLRVSDSRMDVYAFGLILYMLIVNDETIDTRRDAIRRDLHGATQRGELALPFDDSCHETQALGAMTKAAIARLENEDPSLARRLVDVSKSCLNVDPKLRPRNGEALVAQLMNRARSETDVVRPQALFGETRHHGNSGAMNGAPSARRELYGERELFGSGSINNQALTVTSEEISL